MSYNSAAMAFDGDNQLDDLEFCKIMAKRIREEPALYDVEDDNYNNDNYRHQAFRRIEEKMIRLDGLEEAQVPSNCVRDRFRILKRRFISEHHRNGVSSKWPLYEPLNFLTGYVEAFMLRKSLGLSNRKRRKNDPLTLPKVQKVEHPKSEVDVKDILKSLGHDLDIDSTQRVSSSIPVEEFNGTGDEDEEDTADETTAMEVIYKEQSRERFEDQFTGWLEARRAPSALKSRVDYDEILAAVQKKARGEEFDQVSEYNLTCRFILSDETTKTRASTAKPTIWCKSNGKRVVCVDDVFDTLWEVHVAVQHGKRDTMMKRLEQYDGLAVRDLVNLFLSCCRECQTKMESLVMESECVYVIGCGEEEERELLRAKRKGTNMGGRPERGGFGGREAAKVEVPTENLGAPEEEEGDRVFR